MKKKVGLIIGFVLLCSLLLTTGLLSVSASSLFPSLGTGSWSVGTETAIDLEKYPAPFNWYQLVDKGVKITKSGEICHPFRGGQFKWVGDIRQLEDGKWIKTKTTQGWLNGPESSYQICAQAPAAGTYALFAYYIGPKENITTSCAAGLKGIASSPIDYLNYVTRAEWSGTDWTVSDGEGVDDENWLSGYCNLPATNIGGSEITVTVRYPDNTCYDETILSGDTAWISGVIADGRCPIEIYQKGK